jgi:Cof subfamily protein (haloacid dehalogenase superfamily)
VSERGQLPSASARFRLLVLDLDGTARSRVHGVTSGVRAAVAAAQARGVRVCVATGRMWPSAEPWVRALGADSPAILYNGGQLLDFAAERILYERRLPREAARAALAVVRRATGVQPLLYVRDRVYAERHDPRLDAYAVDDGLSYDVGPTFETLLDDEPHKILVIGPRERIHRLQQDVRAARLPVHDVQSEPEYLEILPPGISKGTAMDAMLAALGLSAEEVIAVGDNWNDLEMIERAGLGVAMGHAPQGVRERADYVCGTAEQEGVREVIERFLLGDGQPAPPAT